MAGLGLVSPGIKVKEIDLTRGGITGVSDQTGAIAGPFVKGPVEDPQLIESEKDLVETFGEPQETSSQYEYWLSAASYLFLAWAWRNNSLGQYDSPLIAAGRHVALFQHPQLQHCIQTTLPGQRRQILSRGGLYWILGLK